MSAKIMHLSDLHLGNDFIPRAVLSGRLKWWKKVDERITAGLKNAIRTLRPDYIVISGDLVNKSNENTFGFAAKYLRALFLESGFDINERLLIVPGNHDVSFAPKKHPDDLRRLYLYRQFLRDLYGESDLEARRQRFVIVDPARRVIFACMDSTLKDHTPLAEGEIGNSQRQWLERKMKKLASQIGGSFSQYAKVAIMHHHCVPIAGMSPSSERFMPLLDAGDVEDTLNNLGFNLVLHGHKHYPHVKPRQRSDASVLTVIGAGTATCPYSDEQNGMGNNFNWIEISPETNRFHYQFYKADGNCSFVEVGDPKHFALFRIESLGYSARRMQKTVTIQDDGTKKVTTSKEGLRVETPGKIMKTLPLRIVSDAIGGKITDFDYDDQFVGVKFDATSESIVEGYFVLKSQMEYDSAEIDLSYWYLLRSGTAMCKEDLAKLYNPAREKEESGLIIVHPTRELKIEINFPKKFKTTPEVAVEHLGIQVPIRQLNHKFRFDQALNRCELEMSNPPIDHRITIAWTVPPSWP